MNMKKLISMLLLCALVLSLGAVAAFADGEGEGETPADTAATLSSLADAKLTKDLEVADGIDISDVNTFKFSFTAKGSDTAAAADHPAIAEQTVTVGTQSGGHAYGELAMDKVFTIGDFTHAGEYVYTVKEVAGDNKNTTYDETEYTVHVYVINDGESLKFDGITVEKAGGEKVDPTKETEEAKTTGFNFKNTYKEDIEDAENGVLTVTKSITGNYGDKTKTFPITVTLTLPSTAAESDVALGDNSKGTLSGTTVTAELADGDSIVFTQLPAGTTFTVSEKQAANYEGTIAGDLVTEVKGDAGEDITTAQSQPVIKAGNTVKVTNNREDVIPTGVIINNLPYIVLVLVAVAGVVYLSMKKKADNA